MKKIMFKDRYGLTKAVLEGRKTRTSRIILQKYFHCYKDMERLGTPCLTLEAWLIERAPYKVGEVVAVAQSLRDMGYDPRDTKHKSGAIWGLDHTPAWTNKMFVSASECIHQIRFTNVWAERLQDISEVDCIREGIFRLSCNLYEYRGVCYSFDGDTSKVGTFKTPRAAFAALIDKVSGKGTWESNPWNYAYEFELVK